MAPVLRGRLRRQHAVAVPAERRRHPRLISLLVTGRDGGILVATGLVDDGGIANYAVRVTVRKTPSGWLATSVDGG